MHLRLVLSSVGFATLAAAGIPRTLGNDAGTGMQKGAPNITSHNNITARARAGGYRVPYPYSEMACTGHQLDQCAVEDARDRFIGWGEHNTIGTGKVMWYDDANETVSWWICNCKGFWYDHVVPDELNQVLDILADNCGPWQSGWVWSHDWNKGFNLDRREARHTRYRYQLCPGGCLISPN